MPQTNPFRQEINPFRGQALEAPVEAKAETLYGAISGLPIGAKAPTRAAEAEARDAQAGDVSGGVRSAVASGTADDVKNQLAIQYDVPVNQVELGEDPKLGYVYKVPGMDEYKLIDPVGLDVGDISKGLQVVPAIAGAVAGVGAAVASKSPLAVSTIAAGTAGGVKAAQMGILKSLGIIDPDMEEILMAAGSEAALEFLGGMAPSILKGIWKALPTESAARMRTIEELSKRINPDDLAAGRIKADKIADIVEAETGRRPTFTTGQQLAAVEPERAAGVEGLEEITDIGMEARRSQRQAGEALQQKIDTGAEKEFIKEEAAAGVREVATEIAETAEKSIANTQTKTILRLEQVKSNITQMETSEAGLAIRTAMEEGNAAAYKPLKDAYTQLDEEFAEVVIDTKIMKDAAKALEKETVIFPEWMPDRKLAISQAKKAEAQVAFSDVQAALSDIRTKLRTMGEAGSTPSEMKSLKVIRDSLQEARDSTLAKASPEKANSLLTLETKYANYKEATNKSLIKSILKKGSDQRYIVADKAIINNLIKSADDIRLYKQIAQDQPELNVLPQMREALLVKYRNQVIDGTGSHAKFMQDNRVSVDELLTPKERAMMTSAERAKTALPAALKREKQLVKELNDMIPEYELAQFQSTKVMDRIKGNTGIANKVKNMLQKRHPEKWKAVQEARKFEVAKKSKTLSGLETVLDEQRSELITTLGRDYVKTLDAAVDLARTSGRNLSGKPIREAEERGTLGLARAIVFGPLSHFGFVRNVSKSVLEEKAKRLNLELLQNSEMLEQVIRAHRMSDKTKGMKALAAATGVGLWGSDNELDVPVKEIE